MRWASVFALLLAACSAGRATDLQYVKEARSLAAEWALVNEQAAQGKLTRAYTASMHKSLRDQLDTTLAALNLPDSSYGKEIRILQQQPDDAAPEELRGHSERLKQIEDQLESA